jgi:hypothetical protein
MTGITQGKPDFPPGMGFFGEMAPGGIPHFPLEFPGVISYPSIAPAGLPPPDRTGEGNINLHSSSTMATLATHRTCNLARLVVIMAGVVISAGGLPAQSLQHLFSERFDATPLPGLPAGWTSSASRNPEGDFTVTASGANSPPGCVVSSNAAVPQTLTAPPLDLAQWRDCSLSWMERRSSTHDARIVVEASTDNGAHYIAVTADPLLPPGGTAYVERRVPLPGWTQEASPVLLRWRITGDGTGSTGTLRLDDVTVAGVPRTDLALTAGRTTPSRPLAGDEVLCEGYAINTGYGESGEYTVAWAADIDADGIPGASEYFGSAAFNSMTPGDSSPYEFRFTLPGPGPLSLFAVVSSGSDMAAANDTAIFHLRAAVPPFAVVINEIMYDPLPGKSEYVEIFNRSNAGVDIGGWRLTDREDDSTGGRLATEPFLLAPGGYLLCSPDTSVRSDYPGIPDDVRVVGGMRPLSLNNGGDIILLLDETGAVIDRVGYDPGWHTPALDVTQGRSLERIESTTPGSGPWNWGTSAGSSGGTPGRANSLAEAPPSGEERLGCSPNPFSPDGDGYEDATVIGYRLGGGGPVVARVRIYDAEGRPVRTLTGGSYVTGSGSFVWNGYDDRGRKVPIGVYVILLDAVDATGTESYTARCVVVVAGRL